MAKQYTIQLTTEGYSTSDVADELERAAARIREGKLRGYVNGGEWKLSETKVCEECGGVNGEHEDITLMEAVDPREPHLQAPVGMAKCPKAD